MMFGTVIIDVYKESEKVKIADALEDLCSPCDNYGWSSAGIYCFWDYTTKEILYIGLAVDLYERFKQHNGLSIMDANSCKKKQINEYFRKNKKLGYSIFVQSVLSQPITHRNEKRYKEWLGNDFSKENYVGMEGKEHIKEVEGILLESYKRKKGTFPVWNRMGGSIRGQKATRNGNYEIVQAFSDFEINPLVSRYSLRELSENAMFEGFENYLHAVRISMLHSGMAFEDALAFYNRRDPLNRYEQMVKYGYFDKKLNI